MAIKDHYFDFRQSLLCPECLGTIIIKEHPATQIIGSSESIYCEECYKQYSRIEMTQDGKIIFTEYNE